jgi:hypothetical protein
MKTREMAFQDYKKTLAKLNQQKDKARLKLREQLKIIHNYHHEELKAIRILEQKTKRKRGK